MPVARTTICCSAAAFALASSAPGLTQHAAQPLSLFPTRLLWTLPLNNALTADPGFSGSRGFFSIEAGRLAAYDLAAGALSWTANVGPASEPAIGDNLVFVSEAERLVALRDEDGSVAWEVPFSDINIASQSVPLVWGHGWLIAAESSGSVLGLRALDGRVVWRRDVGSPAHVRPSLTGNRVYVPAQDGRVVALRLETGAPVWERRLGGAPFEILALEDRVFVGSQDNYLYSLRSGDGQVDWRWQTGADVIGRAVADDTRVYFVSLDNVLRALGRRSGSQLWKRPLPMRPRGGPVVAGDTLMVAGVTPTVRAFRRDTGAAAGEIETGVDEVAAMPHVLTTPSGSSVFVVARNPEKGAYVLAVGRRVEPLVTPIAPLPNPIPPTVPATRATPSP